MHHSQNDGESPPEIDRVLHDLRTMHLLSQEEIARVLPELEHARTRLWLLVMRPTATPQTRASEPARVLLTVKDVADQLQFSRGHVYELVRSKRLRGIRDGRVIRIAREALAEWRTAHEAAELDGTRQASGESLGHDELRASAKRPRLRSTGAPGRRDRPPMRRSG